jgi:RNA polymerase sigma-70 factor (ECF subfamily)
MSNQPAMKDPRGTGVRQPSLGAADGAGLALLVEEHHAALYRYAYRLAGSSCDAEDLTQQVFLIARQRLDQVRNAACIRSWFYAVLRNCYLNGKRRPTPLPSSSLSIDLENLPEQVRDDDIDRELVQKAVDELPDEFKLVVLMFYFEDCSYREIAERLELPMGTVMSRLSRAKGHLRNRLLSASDFGRSTQPPAKGKTKRPVSWTT